MQPLLSAQRMHKPDVSVNGTSLLSAIFRFVLLHSTHGVQSINNALLSVCLFSACERAPLLRPLRVLFNLSSKFYLLSLHAKWLAIILYRYFSILKKTKSIQGFS